MNWQRKNAGRWIVLTLAAASLTSAPLLTPRLHAQCATQVWNTSQMPDHPTWLQPFLPANTQPGFAAQLSPTDWLITYQFEHAASDKGAFYKGFVIVRNGDVLRDESLMSVGAWKTTAKKLGYANMPGFTVHAAEVCEGKTEVVTVGFSVCCTTSSAILYFVAAPEPDFYRITALPIVSGGKLEMSQSLPVTLHLWNETNDGTCDGCAQHYKVSEYVMAQDKPKLVQQTASSQRFEPGQFDANRIVILPAGN